MKKLFTFFALIIIAATSANAQNLLANWSGNGVTGTSSKPNDVGWSNTVTASIPWTAANQSGGCRFRDYNVTGGYTGFTYETGGATVDTRQLMLRWDASPYSASVYAYPVTLEACSSYQFDFDFVCGGSATPPKNITVGASSTQDATGRISSKTFASTSSATIYRHGTYSFSTGATAGTYYITLNGDYAWFGINNLTLVKNTTANLSVNQTSLTFDKFSNRTKTFTVSGNALTSDVTLSAPAGISLSTTTITAANAQCGVTVTATYDETKTITNDAITVTVISDALSQTITVNASSSNDATASIINPSFELGNFTGWTNVGFSTQTNTSFTLKNGTYYIEKWQSSGSLSGLRVSQTVSNLPNGYYELKAAAFTNNSTGGAYVFGNTDSIQVFGTADYSVVVHVTDGTLKLGFSAIASSNWVAADNFRLTYLGTSFINVTPTSLTFDEVTTSKTFAISGKGLSGNIILTPPTGISLDKSSITVAEAGTGVTVTAQYDKTVDITNGAISATSGTISKSIAVNANKKVYTSAIINPSFESGFTGWTNNGMATQTNTEFAPKESVSYIEKWTSTTTLPLAACGVTQVVTGLPNGTYTLTAGGQAILQGTPVTYPGGAYIVANKDSVEVTEPKDYSVNVIVTDGTLKVGFHSYTITSNWVAADNFRLIGVLGTNTNVQSIESFNVFTTNEGIKVQFNLEKTSAVEFRVYSTNGVLLSKTNELFSAGSCQKDLNIPLSKGIYLVQMTNSGQTITKKVIK
ncbi:MAG: T9SS type A sorting domain-containing protein [Paludibacteraceae bacterium]